MIMSKVVTLEIRNGVGIVTIDNPPVNALSVDVRRGLSDAVSVAVGDVEINAIVIACAGRTFISGADIREFGRPLQPPGLGEVIDQIEQGDKPVVAAIHGVALGGVPIRNATSRKRRSQLRPRRKFPPFR